VSRDPTPAPARRSPPLDVVGLGECSLDHVCVVPRHPQRGEDLDLVRYDRRPGGQVATAVLGCARLGLRTAFAGAVGDDPGAEEILRPLREAGVDVAGVRRVAGAPSRTALVLVEERGGERTVLGYRDPRLALRPEQLDAGLLCRGRVLHLDARDPEAAAWACQRARERGVAVVLDADRCWAGWEALLRSVDFPIVSRSFAEECGGTGSARDGLRRLAELAPRLAVVTLGDRGAMAARGRQIWSSPAFAVDARDTTGAGDAFRAGFVWALLRSGPGTEDALDVVSLLRAANAVAALNCTAFGAQGGLPEPRDVERLLATGSAASGPGPEPRAGATTTRR